MLKNSISYGKKIVKGISLPCKIMRVLGNSFPLLSNICGIGYALNYVFAEGGERKGTHTSTEDECYNPKKVSSAFNAFPYADLTRTYTG